MTTLPMKIHPDYYNAALDWAEVNPDFRLIETDDGLAFAIDTAVDGEALVSALISAITIKWVEAGCPRV